MQFPAIPIDGNWVDICSLASGLIYVVYRKIRRPTRTKWASKSTGIDFANGAAIFPLLVLTFCVLSSELVTGLVQASKMSLSTAGFFALLAILDDNDTNNSSWP